MAMPERERYRDRILDELAEKHQDQLGDALDTLERQIRELMNEAPLRGDALFDLEWAVSARPKIQGLMANTYSRAADAVVREYQGVAVSAERMLNQYGDFTDLDPAVVTQLQQLSFQGFEDVASTHLDIISRQIYQNTITGNSFEDSVRQISQSINGVYASTDDREAQKLVNLAKFGSPAEQKDAIEKLHTKFSRDRLGRNMRRYATQIAQDSLMQFDASINIAVAKATGITKFKYYGSLINDSREFCRKHVGKTYTEEEIKEIWSADFQGKSPGDPLIVRGGYNCRHHWLPIVED